MRDGHARALAYKLGYAPAVTMRRIAFVAEQAHRPARPYQGGEGVKLLARRSGGEMPFVDPEQLVEATAAGGLPAFRGRAEPRADADRRGRAVQPRRQLPLGESGSP